jgi:hypothetical protein
MEYLPVNDQRFGSFSGLLLKFVTSRAAGQAKMGLRMFNGAQHPATKESQCWQPDRPIDR